MPAVDAEVIFVTKSWDCEINPRCALRAGFGLGVFDRPTRVAVLLAQFGRLFSPCRRNAAF